MLIASMFFALTLVTLTFAVLMIVALMIVASTGSGLASLAKARLSGGPASRTRSYFSYLCFLVMLVVGSLGASGEVIARSHQSVLLAGLDDDQNPYAYLYGSVAKGDVIRDHRGQYATSVMFQPRYASRLFTKSVLFCGNRVDAFHGADTIVVTYRRVPHRMVEGVPCFDLVSVDRVEPGDLPQQ
jgi:hypothetical protein